MGARAWTQRAKRQGVEVKASYVLESIGYFTDEPGTQVFPFGFDALFPEAGQFVVGRQNRGDFIAAITDDLDPTTVGDFSAGAARVDLPVAEVVLNAGFRTDPSLGDLRRSDHAEFWAQDWPGIMITTTANFRNPNYHCTSGPDDIADVDMERAFKVVQAAAFAAARQARPADGSSQPLDSTTDPTPPMAACDLYAQDCGANQKCTFLGGGTTFAVSCVPAGPTAEGQVCTRGPNGPGDDDCVPGTYCAFFGQPLTDPQVRTCQLVCQTNADCPGGQVCAEIERAHHVGLCTPACDPRDPAACGEGQVCLARWAANPSDGLAAICNPGAPGAVQRGSACAAATPCAPGLYCVPGIAGRPAQCQPWCAGPADCGEGSTCQPTGLPDRGVCLPD